jgi:hypothetical protein
MGLLVIHEIDGRKEDNLDDVCYTTGHLTPMLYNQQRMMDDEWTRCHGAAQYMFDGRASRSRTMNGSYIGTMTRATQWCDPLKIEEKSYDKYSRTTKRVPTIAGRCDRRISYRETREKPTRIYKPVVLKVFPHSMYKDRLLVI